MDGTYAFVNKTKRCKNNSIKRIDFPIEVVGLRSMFSYKEI